MMQKISEHESGNAGRLKRDVVRQRVNEDRTRMSLHCDTHIGQRRIDADVMKPQIHHGAGEGAATTTQIDHNRRRLKTSWFRQH